MRGLHHHKVAAISFECSYVDGKCLNFVPNSNDQYVREIVERVLCTSLSFASLLSVATSCDVKCRDVAVSLKSCYSYIVVRILKLAGIKSTLLVRIHLQCSSALCKYFLLLRKS